MQLFVLLALFAVVASAVPTLDLKNPEWLDFKLKHGKVYASAFEEVNHLAAYNSASSRVARHNDRYAKGQVTFQLGMNKYSDVPHAQFVKTMNGYKGAAPVNYCYLANPTPPPSTTTTTTTTTTTIAPPVTVDWRNQGAVTPVKDQGQCGSCWSFSANAALESQYFLKTGKLVSLSEQNLIDCANSTYGNNGCNGGWMGSAYNYVIANKGVDTEAAYPYLAYQSTCNFAAASVGATMSSYIYTASGNETALAQAVQAVGPIAVAIDASQNSFQLYSSGIYYEPACSSTSLDHAVLLVGYGTNATLGGDYWIIKNSWGTSWGMNGYMYMSRNRNNNCGIATDALYPVI